jgi:pantetheine-phosphate adenylyltransferase
VVKAVYPGSFDPVTYGHLDVINRAAAAFDDVHVAVVINPNKNPLFSLEERVELIRECTKHLPNVTVGQFSGLLVKYVEESGASVIIKGLRAVSDFEYEFQMALMNRKQNPNVETLFMMTNSRYSYLSSSLVKEVLRLGGCVRDLVPPIVEARMRQRMGLTAPQDRNS